MQVFERIIRPILSSIIITFIVPETCTEKLAQFSFVKFDASLFNCYTLALNRATMHKKSYQTCKFLAQV